MTATSDLMTRVIRLNDRLIVSRVHMRGRWLVQLEKSDSHQYFRIGEAEYDLLSSFDGTKTVATVCGEVASRHVASGVGAETPSTQQSVAIVRWMIENGIGAFTETSLDSADSFASAKKRSWWLSLNPFWMTIPLLKRRSAVGRQSWSRLLDPIAAAFSPMGLIVWCIVIATGSATLALTWQQFLRGDINVFDRSQWVAMAGIWLVLKLLHELAHAAACRRFGGNVREAGLVFVLFAPLAYVDVTDAWRIQSRRQRIVVSLAGMMLELFVAAVAIIAAVWVESPSAQLLLQQTVLIAGVSTVLFNANPLMRFDGYHVLADAVDVPNLDAISRKMLTDQAKRLLIGRSPDGANLEGWRWWFALAFALAAWAWRTMIAVSLLIAAAWLAKGSGIFIAIAGATIWYGRPLWRLARWIRRSAADEPTRLARSFSIATALCLVGYVLLFQVGVPTSLSSPALVRFPVDSLVRCRADGFLQELLVHDGKTVAKGDRLARLSNPDLDFAVQDLKLRIQIAQQRVRAALNQHDVAAEQIESANLTSLEEQLQHKQQEADGLVLTAHCDGVVVARQLNQQQGTWLHRGDALMKIVQINQKEAIAMVDQRDIDLVRQASEQVEIAVEGQPRFQGVVRRLEPRATDRLPSEALAAPSGGPLAVQPVDPDDPSPHERWQLLEPRFRVVAQLGPDAAHAIPDGTVVQARFGTRRDSVAFRIRDSVRALWYQAQSIANR